ncbi:MAG: hypothetical protein CVU89_13290 [Firmicutes bacterium HGW-Firmicutes-14]|nr:MAG: hypothetical protein CVU89_13290 [Firmicutes bacterium HGW-Firmicutes-14]
MLSTPVFVALMAVSGLGLVLGAVYHFVPEKIVGRRIKDHHRETARKDDEFRKWLELEIKTQIKRCRRLGMIIVIIEAIFMAYIINLWLKSF